jgi:hypothetical protein
MFHCLPEIFFDLRDGRAYVGIDLDHRLDELLLNTFTEGRMFVLQDVVGDTGQVKGIGIQQLEFQLNADGWSGA